MLLVVAVSATAIPARREGFVRVGSDGTEKIVFQHGDEHFHYITDAEGQWLDEETLAPLTAEEANALRQEGEARRAARRVQRQKMIGTTPNIAPRGLLIMVNFQDKAFVTPYDTIDHMLNGENFTRSYTKNGNTITASGSARQYFYDQSYGQYNPQFDVVGPYTVSHNYAYYGKNDDANVGEMIKEACELADQDGVDFTLYDNNEDGKVDFVYVLYAWEGQADGGPANTVWPHNYDLGYMEYCQVDGKRVRNYACSNELQHASQIYDGIGTFCHEFSHVMGLPDLYETNQTPLGNHTLYDWDILDYGPYSNDGNTPPAYSAYERFFCGWITPRVLKDPENVTLHLLNESGEALLLCEGDTHNLVGYDPTPQTFYLLEARTQEGWDRYLPGRGMLITKIQYNSTKWAYNSVNNDPDNMGVDLIEARKNTTSFSLASDAFPFSTTKNWYGFEGHMVENIVRKSDGTITFIYNDGWPEGIEDVQRDDVRCTKVLRDGKVIIIREGKTYTILGNRL